ncbi:MAG: sugar transferase [Candidatus Taylorbacteria bacterium]|nr:sugar transferase [Candidatus Taylorbacteria bacterium]
MNLKIPKIILSALDSTSLTLAFLLSLFLRQSTLAIKYFGGINYNTGSYLISFIIAFLLLLMIFSAFKLYQLREIELSGRIFTVLKALAIWAFTTAALIYIIKYDFSRGIFFMTITFTAVLICLGRYFLFKKRQRDSRNKDLEAIIVGTGSRACDIEKQIKAVLPNANIKKFDYSQSNTTNFLRNLEQTDIFLADERLSREEVLTLITNEKFAHHSFRVILDTFKLATGEIRLNDIDEIPSIAPQREPQTSYRLIKRLFDLIISLLGIIIISPLWLLTVILIRLDSPGPAIIKQTRIGWNGRPFTILKFRTMQIDVPLYQFAPRNQTDQRITRVGKLLRRFSLDELPQLWNIFTDDMSLVGPRPEMEFIVKNYAPWQNFRLKTKPGLTGLWQILGRKDLPLHENLEYDFYYVTNRSLLLDSVIILKTIPAVLFGRGAY